jgi:hypothetical protein
MSTESTCASSGTPARAISSVTIADSTTVRPNPPYSTGQFAASQPRSPSQR